MTNLKKISTGLLATALLTAGVGSALAANDQLAAKLTASIPATEINETLPEGIIKMDKINFEIADGTEGVVAIDCTFATGIKEGEALPEGAVLMNKINLKNADGAVGDVIYVTSIDLLKDGEALPEGATIMEQSILATATVPAIAITPDAK